MAISDNSSWCHVVTAIHSMCFVEDSPSHNKFLLSDLPDMARNFCRMHRSGWLVKSKQLPTAYQSARFLVQTHPFILTWPCLLTLRSIFPKLYIYWLLNKISLFSANHYGDATTKIWQVQIFARGARFQAFQKNVVKAFVKISRGANFKYFLTAYFKYRFPWRRG